MTKYPAGAARLDAAVRAWNAAHPLTFAGRSCPVCSHRGCFGPLPGDPSRWACFSADHARTGCGRAGARCWSGDALDLEAYRAGLTRLDVLRRDGFAAPVYARPPRRSREEELARRWEGVGPRRDARDLVRLDAHGRPWIRCYGASGAPCGLARLDRPLPPGWIGSTRAGAEALVTGEPVDVTVAAPGELWGILAALPADRVILVGQPVDVRRVRAAVEPCDATPVLVEVWTLTPDRDGEEVADG